MTEKVESMKVDDMMVLLRAVDSYVKQIEHLREGLDTQIAKNCADRELERARGLKKKIGNIWIL